MSYSNGLLPSSTSTNQQQRGLPGVGFVLTDDGDYDIQNKKLTNVGDPQTNSDASTKGYIDMNYLKQDGSTPMTGNLNMSGKQIDNLRMPSSIYQAVNRHYVDIQASRMLRLDGSLEMDDNLNMGGNRITNLASPDSKDVVTKAYVDTLDAKKADKSYVDSVDAEKADKSDLDAQLLEYVKKDGSTTMFGDLNMGRHAITGLEDPLPHEYDQAVNVGFFNTEINKSNSNLYTQITNSYKDYVNKKSISTSTNKKNPFQYLMEVIDESSSEFNITVIKIATLATSPHSLNKSVYYMKLNTKDENTFKSRIGFNLHPLPLGEYTGYVEFIFPNQASDANVYAESSVVTITSQATSFFNLTNQKYTRSIIHLHKWNDPTPNYLMLDLTCQVPISSNVPCYLIIYGVEGHQNNVEPSVYDQLYFVNDGKMMFNLDLDLNGNSIIGDDYILYANTYKKGNESRFIINGSEFVIIPFNVVFFELLYSSNDEDSYKYLLNNTIQIKYFHPQKKLGKFRGLHYEGQLNIQMDFNNQYNRVFSNKPSTSRIYEKNQR